MKIDIGAPSQRGVSGINRRIDKLNSINKIPFGVNLDLGAGIGAYYPALKKHSKTLFALDGEISYLKKFCKHNPSDQNKVLLSTAENIAIKNGMFDAVFTIEVLEHVENLGLSLKEIHRILKPNGLLYITVPNKYFPLETHMVHFGNFFVKGRYIPFLSMLNFIHKKIGTARRFSEKDIQKDFTKVGFNLIDVDYMMPPFDYFKLGRKYFKKFSDKIEKSFLKKISMTLIVVLRKI